MLKDLDLASLRHIVIVKPSSLGDIVHTLPLLAILRQHCPQAKIQWVVNSVWAPLIRGHELLDGLIEFPRQEMRGLKAPSVILDWQKKHRGTRPDLVLDVQGLMRSALMAKALRPNRIVGYSDAREGANLLHQDIVDVSLKRSPHAVDRYLTFFQALDLPLPENIEFPLPPGKPLPNEISLPENFILLHPFSRGQGKSLTLEQVIALSRSWSNYRVVLAGRADEGPLDLPENTLNLLNQTTLPQLIWLLRRSAWVVSVDSGPMHLAAALTRNLLSIHTWSDPLKVGPYRKDAWVWKAGRMVQAGDYEADSSEEAETAFEDSAVEPLASFISDKMSPGTS